MPGTLLVRPPSTRLAEGQITHIERSDGVTHAAALKQWTGYVDTFRARGWTVIEVPLADDCPDSVFIEDAVVMFGNTAVITSPGHETRVAETIGVEATINESLPGIKVARIQAPGTLDGGDVLKVGTDVYVGRGGRTNGEGIRQLRDIVGPLGYVVHPVPVTKALHLSEYRMLVLRLGSWLGTDSAAADTHSRIRSHRPPGRHGHRVRAHCRRPARLPALHARAGGTYIRQQDWNGPEIQDLYLRIAHMYLK